MERFSKGLVLATACLSAVTVLGTTPARAADAHVIDIIADKDSRFKIPNQSKPEITIKAGEPVVLRIDARRGKTWNRDGVVHGFTVIRKKDRVRVQEWDLELRSGMQEFKLVAPSEPGEYEVLCTVICSDDHEGMRARMIVVP
jgi:heme/copper-type cytochrome/quinol oxidase subunit 2